MDILAINLSMVIWGHHTNFLAVGIVEYNISAWQG